MMMKRAVFCFALMLVLSASAVRADLVDQIGTFTPSPPYFGLYAALSQFDAPATAPDLQDFATAYENLSFATTGVIDSFSWVGQYDSFAADIDLPFNPTFTISFYSNNAGEPDTLLQTYNVGTAGETLEVGRFYSYSTTATPFTVTAGETYWASVVANLNYDTSGWGLAFSTIGDGASIQDFQEPGDAFTTRNFDTIDYAIRVTTAVPEPGSVVAIMMAGGLFYVRRKVINSKRE